MILLSLIVPHSPLFKNTLYIGLVITIWSWVGLTALTSAMDDDITDKEKIVFFVLLIATPFVYSAVSTFVAARCERSYVGWSG